MDSIKEAALVKLIGPDLAAKVLSAGGYDETETTKAAGMKTTLKAASPLDDALDALDEWLEEVETDANSQALADQVTAFTAQLQAKLTATPIKPSAKVTDGGHTSVAAKSTRPADFWEWMTPGRARQ